MLEHLILMLSILGSGHVGTATIFGSSSWDRTSPHSRLACYHREINDKTDFVIAHNTLPCGTKVWLFNPRTGLSTLAEVADRGPRHAYADLAQPVARAIALNGREPILLVPLPRLPKALVPVTGPLVPAPIEESWETPYPMVRAPLVAPQPVALPMTEESAPPDPAMLPAGDIERVSGKTPFDEGE